MTLAVLDTAADVPAISDIPAGAAATPGAGNAEATEEATAIAEETGDCVGVRDWLRESMSAQPNSTPMTSPLKPLRILKTSTWTR